jgi:hypothetical protein
MAKATFTELFKKIDDDISSNLMTRYEGELDISKVLDTSYLKDDLQGLIKEITQQPAVYAYWANLRRIADERYEEVERKFELAKSRRMKMVLQDLSSNGITRPNQKQVEAKFHDINKEAEWYTKFQAHLKTWGQRKKTLAIIEKAVSARGDSFRSLSYLVGNMMNQGIYYKQQKSKTF